MKSFIQYLNTKAAPSRPFSRRGFTMLEVMVAIVILVTAMSIAFEVFSATVRGWKRGMEVADGIKHGDFAMNQLVAALNSTIYFMNPRRAYAFTVEKDTLAGLPADSISFVTASGAFMPPESPYAKGPHRITLFIDFDEYNNPALYALAMPAVANPDDMEEDYPSDPLLISRSIGGMEIFFWDKNAEDWIDEWEQANSVPERILVDVYVTSADEEEEPIRFSRVLEIPVSPSVKERLRSPVSTQNNRGR